ncbi:NADH dehydrogenase (ubiquinone) [Azoarcus olearius]|uniref:NADH dehydrogenase (Ubiquinone) n=1 Tax=Azoarcus sp. (strain BH72) TaxID=418699 RepID=A1K6I8_AZOSB|nr:NADH dehydrogenase (ubiquinone) [Azoarcus olearius]
MPPAPRAVCKKVQHGGVRTVNVLVTGATGFLGGSIVDRLLREGHQLRCAVRDPVAAVARRPGPAYFPLDYRHATTADAWREMLVGVEVVINAVGILREQGDQRFDLLHRAAPRALFDACVEAGVRRVLQISALGADAGAASAYHLSKRAADDHLLALPLEATVVQPSLVFGGAGASTALFASLASMPVVALPGGGRQRIQPVHVDDLVEAVARLVVAAAAPRRLAVVGPAPLCLRSYLASLRRAMGIRRPLRVLPVPIALARRVAVLARWWPKAPLDEDALDMLERGNVGDPAPLTALLGEAPRAVSEFVPRPWAGGFAQRARLAWLLPLLRATIGVMWIATALVSFGLYPVAASLELLARAGVPEGLRLLALYGAAALDLVLGVLCFTSWQRRRVWAAQAALIAAYTLIISWKLPEFWLHPYGPLTKNLPLLAALWLLYETEPD